MICLEHRDETRTKTISMVSQQRAGLSDHLVVVTIAGKRNLGGARFRNL